MTAGLTMWSGDHTKAVAMRFEVVAMVAVGGDAAESSGIKACSANPSTRSA